MPVDPFPARVIEWQVPVLKHPQSTPGIGRGRRASTVAEESGKELSRAKALGAEAGAQEEGGGVASVGQAQRDLGQ